MNTSNFILVFSFTFPHHFSDFHFQLYTVLSAFGSSLLFEYYRCLERKLYFCQFVFLFVSAFVSFTDHWLFTFIFISLFLFWFDSVPKFLSCWFPIEWMAT